MPKKKSRDYRSEYDNFHSSEEQKKKRSLRNKARRDAKKNGADLKGVDIDHKTPLRSGGSNNKKNLRKRSIKSNRADNGHKPGESQKKKRG